MLALISLWYQAEIISLCLQALIEPVPTLPIKLRSLSGGWLPPSSATSKHLCYFLFGLGWSSWLKMCNALPLSSSSWSQKSLIWTLQAKILSVVCCTCRMAEIALWFVVSLDLVFHVCVVSKDCVLVYWIVQWGSQVCDNHQWLIVWEHAWAEREEGRGRYTEILRSSFPPFKYSLWYTSAPSLGGNDVQTSQTFTSASSSGLAFSRNAGSYTECFQILHYSLKPRQCFRVENPSQPQRIGNLVSSQLLCNSAFHITLPSLFLWA